MPREIIVPAAGESVTSALVSAWHRKDGDAVKKGDLLVTLDTDKVSQELTADSDGILKITAPEGTEVGIGASIGTLDESAAGAASAAPEAKAPEAPTAETVEKTAPSPSAPVASTPASAPALVQPVPEPKTAPKIDLTVLPAPEKPSEPAVADASGRVTRRRMSPLRRKIATHLVNAQHTAAILTTFNEADMSEIMALRKVLQDAFVARHGVKIGFMSFFIKAVVEALKSVPQVNGRIEGDEVIEQHYYDIGVAVGTEKGLVVPVLRNCDKKSFGEIEKELGEVAKRARDGKIAIEDLQGGVFTISNGGIYGSLLSTPILNPPQSAILGMHTIQERPVARDGQVVIRPMMYLALSYDHRLIDGKEAVTFLIRIKECLEQPSRLLLGA